MATIDLGLLTATSNIDYSESISLLEPSDRFLFRVENLPDLTVSLGGAALDIMVREQGGAIVQERSASEGGDFTLTGLSNDITYELEATGSGALEYTLAIDPVTGEAEETDDAADPVAAIPEDGTFIVNASGREKFGYVLDGGSYQGELGLFSLSGLESFDWGSEAWIEAVAQRVLSDSPQGYRLINDRDENPWLPLFYYDEPGIYSGIRELELTPGDAVAVVLVPNGTFEEVLANPRIGGNKRPLFSIATTNPDDFFHVGQIGAAGDTVYVMEDQRVDEGSDKDYNDVGFSFTATPRGIGAIDDLIDPDKDDWREDFPLLSNVAPIVEFEVVDADEREFPIAGTVTDENGAWDIQSLTAQVIDSASGAVLEEFEVALTADGDGGYSFVIGADDVSVDLTTGDRRLVLIPRDLNGAGQEVVAIEADLTPSPTPTPNPEPTPTPTPSPGSTPIYRPDALDFEIWSLYTTDETVKFENALVSDPDGWSNISKVDFSLVRDDGEVINLADNVERSELRNGGDGTARFGFEFDLEDLEPGRYRLVGQAYDTDTDGSLGGYLQRSKSFVVMSGRSKDVSGAEEPIVLSNAERVALAEAVDLALYEDDELESDTWIVAIDPDADPAQVALDAGAIDLGASAIPNGRIWRFETLPDNPVQHLQDTDEVELFYPDLPVTLRKFFTPDPGEHYYPELHPSVRASLEAMWQIATGDGVTIAVNDDGVDLNHPEFAADRVFAELNRDLTVGLGAPIDRDISPRDVQSLEFELDELAEPDDEFVEPGHGGIVYAIPVQAIGQALSVKVSVDLENREDLSAAEIAALEAMEISLHLPHHDNTQHSPKIWNSSRFWLSWRPRWGDPEAVPPSLDFDFDSIWSAPNGRSLNDLQLYSSNAISTAHAEIGGDWALTFDLDAAPASIANPWRRDSENFHALVEKAIEGMAIDIEYADSHGTAVASLAVGGNNGGGILGTAPESDIVVTRILGPLDPVTLTDEQPGSIIGRSLFDADRHDFIDVQVNSWGLPPLASAPDPISALEDSTVNGTIQVVAAGNDRQLWPGAGNTNNYLLASSRRVISVGAVTINENGVTHRAPYSNPGAFVTTYAGAPPDVDIRHWAAGATSAIGNLREGTYFNTGSGTSMAAPIVAGMIAAMQEANPTLSERDVQQILVKTSRKVDADGVAEAHDLNHNVERLNLGGLTNQQWQTNAAGVEFSYQYGFGVVDPEAAVKAAQDFDGSYEVVPVSSGTILASTPLRDANQAVSLPKAAIAENITAEWIEVSLNIDHDAWSELTVVLESPDGTPVVLKRALQQIGEDDELEALPVMTPKQGRWVYSSPYFWGESAEGDWTLRVYDEHNNTVNGALKGWQLDVFGTQPEVSVEATDGSAIEGGDGALLTFTRSGNISEPLVANLQWENAAEVTWNGEALPSAIQFAAGASTISLPIVAIEDGVDEGVESLTVSIVDDAVLRLSDVSSASVSIADGGLRLDPVDYSALKALYDESTGLLPISAGWSDWDFSSLVPPPVSLVEDWRGIDLAGRHVSSIELSSVGLTGEIPSELGNLSQLESLVLANNSFTGAIPTEFGNLAQITDLNLALNQLEGNIPQELSNLTNLSILNLGSNNLNGEIPSELASLSNLSTLYLNNNELTGGIPIELSTLPVLAWLDLHNNELTGEIPDEFGNFTNIQRISLSENSLEGGIPTSFGNLVSIEQLYLSNAGLSGEIPSGLGNLPRLSSLRLSNNNLDGEIPPELGNASNLFNLYLDRNNLSGEIPPELGNLSRLSSLYLNENSLGGEIPLELLDLDNLNNLYLQNNNLTGDIPTGLIDPPTIEMPSLVNIDLSGNNFWNPSLTVSNTNNSGNGSLRAAIELANNTSGTDLIVFDIPTSDPGYNSLTGTFTIQPLSALPTITDSIVIDGTSQSGYSDRPRVEIDGSNTGAGVDGLLLNASDSIIRGLAVNRFGDEGIQAQGDNNTFSDNFLGTDPTGTVDLGNAEAGLFISGGDTNTVENNLISGNAAGFQTRGTNGVIRGNLIGTDITGTVDLGNDGNGVSIDTGASGNLFGGTSEADRNIVAGNDFHGILIDGSNNRIQGNYIGVDITGENALANERQGIRLSAASGGSGNLIGGTEAGAGNVIANGDRGVVVYADNTIIQGNLIGTDATGTQNFGSNSQAIRVEADGTIIGGTSTNARNVISGSETAQGILLLEGSATVQGNYIGTDITGTQAIPNAQSGIYIFEPSANNLIGGTEPGAGNTIANNNGGVGVDGTASTGNMIVGNSAFDNNGLAISLLNGSNSNPSVPTLTSASVSGSSTSVAGNLNAPANSNVRVEFFSDDGTEGQTFLGSQTLTTDGVGNVSFNVELDTAAPHQNVTATVTDADGNTSRFSSPIALTRNGQVTVTVNRVNEIYNFDLGDITGGADWGAEITINGQPFQTPYVDDMNDLRPNWQFSQNVTGTNIPISIKLADDDTIDLGFFGTIPQFETADISPAAGETTLNLNFNTLTGEIIGSGINGTVGNEIFAQGGGGEKPAQIWFTVSYA